MFRLPENTEMTIDLLGKLLKEHKQEVENRHQKLQDTYESDHEILHKPKKPKHKPDNRIVVNFPKYLVDTFNGFFIGIPVKTTHKDEKVTAYVEELDARNDQDDNNSELSKIMDIHGRGFELYFTDGEAKLRITYLSPLEAFMVFDDTVLEEPLFFVRFYTDYFGKEKGRVYNRVGYRDFQVSPEMKFTGKDEWTPHNFPGVPATEFIENAERQGLFEPVQTMVDAFNKGISDAANNVDYFADAYMKILGAKLDKEGADHIKENRIINFEGEDGRDIIVDFLSKPTNDEGQEHLLDRLERLIFQIAMMANISDENFGTSSGIALKYKLLAESNLFQTKKRKFTSGMNRRYKLLFGHPASSTKVPADAWMKLKYTFTPNIPANILEEAQIAAQLEGIVSHETQLKILSFIEDVMAELERIKKENEELKKSMDNLGFDKTGGDDGDGE